MNKMAGCIFCVSFYPMQLLEQELKTYQSQFKKIPLLSSLTQITDSDKANGQHIVFQQKLGFKKKKVEYTLALRY
jgi:hypothetical protein